MIACSDAERGKTIVHEGEHGSGQLQRSAERGDTATDGNEDDEDNVQPIKVLVPDRNVKLGGILCYGKEAYQLVQVIGRSVMCTRSVWCAARRDGDLTAMVMVTT